MSLVTINKAFYVKMIDRHSLKPESFPLNTEFLVVGGADNDRLVVVNADKTIDYLDMHLAQFVRLAEEPIDLSIRIQELEDKLSELGADVLTLTTVPEVTPVTPKPKGAK